MAGKDQYMNFFTIKVESAANSSNLVSHDANTGSGMATNLAWRIHKVEWYTGNNWSGGAGGSEMLWAISTRKGLAAMPELDDKGTIAVRRINLSLFGAGDATFPTDHPMTLDFLPPMIIATPNLSLYFQSVNNFAGAQNTEQSVRIGFTTEKLSESLYREVFETWNYAN